MKATIKILAGGVGLAALAAATPAAAQYYPNPYPAPGYGYGYGQSGGLGAIIDSILGGNRYAYGADRRHLVERCIAAVNSRIARQYSGYRGRYGAPYGHAYDYGGGQARVLGITDIDNRRTGLRVRGVATAGGYAAAPQGYGYGYGYDPRYGYGNDPRYGQGYGQPQGELSFRCNIDYRGRILDIDVDRNRNAYYGYRRR